MMSAKSSSKLRKYQPPERVVDDSPDSWCHVKLGSNAVASKEVRDAAFCHKTGALLHRFKVWDQDGWVYWWTLDMSTGKGPEYGTDHSSEAAQPPWTWAAKKMATHVRKPVAKTVER